MDISHNIRLVFNILSEESGVEATTGVEGEVLQGIAASPFSSTTGSVSSHSSSCTSQVIDGIILQKNGWFRWNR
jgi:hypothetical protein